MLADLNTRQIAIEACQMESSVPVFYWFINTTTQVIYTKYKKLNE